jgi:hypothetical protein
MAKRDPAASGTSRTASTVTESGAGAGVGRVGVGAEQQGATTQVQDVADVGPAEASVQGVRQDTELWGANKKLLFANEFNDQRFYENQSRRMVRNGEDADQERRERGKSLTDKLDNAYAEMIGACSTALAGKIADSLRASTTTTGAVEDTILSDRGLVDRIAEVAAVAAVKALNDIQKS